MTWDEGRRRGAALDAVLAFAASYPDADLPMDELPALAVIFGGRRGVVVALQARWTQLLAAFDAPSTSLLESADAWLHCSAANPELRRLLDRNLPALGDAAMERHEELLLA